MWNVKTTQALQTHRCYGIMCPESLPWGAASLQAAYESCCTYTERKKRFTAKVKSYSISQLQKSPCFKGCILTWEWQWFNRNYSKRQSFFCRVDKGAVEVIFNPCVCIFHLFLWCCFWSFWSESVFRKVFFTRNQWVTVLKEFFCTSITSLLPPISACYSGQAEFR